MVGQIGRIGLLALAGLAAILLTAPASAQADSCAGDGEYMSDNPAKAERVVLCLTNVHRAANGIHPLTMDPILLVTARAYSADMASRNFFNHFGGPGCDQAQGTSQSNGCSMPWHRAMANGFPSDQVGENIARGFLQTPFDVFNGFRNSPGHNANMLGTGYVTGGFGVASGHVTENFSSFPNGGTDTAVDLLITTECENATDAVTLLEAELAAAKQRYKKAKKKGKGVAGAKKRFKKAKKKLAAAEAAKKKQCRPQTSY